MHNRGFRRVLGRRRAAVADRTHGITAGHGREPDLTVKPSALAAHATAMRPWRADPSRRGQCALTGERAVLTHLLTTALDQHGHARNERPSEQVRCDLADSGGRPSSSS